MITQSQKDVLKGIKGLSLNDAKNAIYNTFSLEWGDSVGVKVIFELDAHDDITLVIYECINNNDTVDLLHLHDLDELCILNVEVKENQVTLYVDYMTTDTPESNEDTYLNKSCSSIVGYR